MKLKVVFSRGGTGLTKVLIIDDDRTVRHIVTTGLSGYSDITVVPAADGDVGAPAEAPVRALAPVTAGDAAFFSDDPWGVDLRRTGISFTR